MIHNTSIIERCEKNAKQMVRGFVESGFGHNFESTFTQLPLGLEGSSGHHRVLRYSLGDLSCAVRFEVDAYYRDPAESSEGEDISKSSLVETFNSLQLGAPSLNDNKSQPISARVIPRGTITPQSSTAELKTRAKSSSLVKFLPQLWFGRTAYLIIGCHAIGTFQRVNITRVKHQFEDWERKRGKSNCTSEGGEPDLSVAGHRQGDKGEGLYSYLSSRHQACGSAGFLPEARNETTAGGCCSEILGWVE